MVASQPEPLANWIRPLRSPLRWVIWFYAVLFPTVLVLWSTYPTSEVLKTLDGSLVIAQLCLIGSWTTLNAREGGETPFSPEVIVPFLVSMLLVLPLMMLLMIHAFLVGAPMWICVPILANAILSQFRLKGWQLKRFDCTTMPSPREFQFSIRSILIATTCVAMLFAIRAFSTLLEDSQGEFTFVAFLPWLGIMVVVYGSAPVVAVWAALTPGRILPRLTAAGFGLGLVVVLMFHDVKDRNAMQIVSVPILAGSMCVFLATLLVLRAIRYRVVWGTPIPGRIQPGRNDPSGTPNVS